MLPALSSRHYLGKISQPIAIALTDLAGIAVTGAALLATIILSAPFLLFGPFIPAWQASVEARIDRIAAWSTQILTSTHRPTAPPQPPTTT